MIPLIFDDFSDLEKIVALDLRVPYQVMRMAHDRTRIACVDREGEQQAWRFGYTLDEPFRKVITVLAEGRPYCFICHSNQCDHLPAGSPYSATPQLISSRALADYLNVSCTTVLQAARTGKIPYTKIGRTYRFDRFEVDKQLWFPITGDVSGFRQDIRR